jgi:hypothetical protein
MIEGLENEEDEAATEVAEAEAALEDAQARQEDSNEALKEGEED